MNEKKRPANRAGGTTKGPGRPSAKKEKREGKSIRWMVTALLIAVMFLAWAVAAASYASDVEGFDHPDMPAGGGRGAAVRGGFALFVVGFVRMLWNAIVQIPNVHRVTWHTLTEHPFIPIVASVVVGGVCCFGWWMATIERQFAREDRKFRRVKGDD